MEFDDSGFTCGPLRLRIAGHSVREPSICRGSPGDRRRRYRPSCNQPAVEHEGVGLLAWLPGWSAEAGVGVAGGAAEVVEVGAVRVHQVDAAAWSGGGQGHGDLSPVG